VAPAWHRRARSFAAAEPGLASGAIAIIDDIRWDDPRFYENATRSYEGWTAVAEHRRVRHAIEVAGSWGIVLVD
jgi:hypothetical protein